MISEFDPSIVNTVSGYFPVDERSRAFQLLKNVEPVEVYRSGNQGRPTKLFPIETLAEVQAKIKEQVGRLREGLPDGVYDAPAICAKYELKWAEATTVLKLVGIKRCNTYRPTKSRPRQVFDKDEVDFAFEEIAEIKAQIQDRRS